MAASVYFPLSPLRGRDQRHDGDLISNRDMKRRMILLRRAQKATRLLLADGWTVWFAVYAIEADHPDVETQADAEARFAILGLPRCWAVLFGCKNVVKEEGGWLSL